MTFLTVRRLALAAVASLSASLMMAATAHATILFQTGNHPQPNEENILFGAKESGTSILGYTNQSDVGVTFATLTGQTLLQNASGQADIYCSANCIDGGKSNTASQLNSLNITVASGYGATDFIGNLNFGEGTAQIAVTDQTGATFDYLLGNGQNYFTLTAIDNEVITNIQITEATNSTNPFGWNDFKQPRISGLCTLTDGTCTPILTPEPAALTLFATALFALGYFVRRRKNTRTHS